ncbi:MAG: hypothetical protein U0N74_08860 [Peptococcaceae bacterium]
MLMQLGAVDFYADFCEKLALYGGWWHLFYLSSVPLGVVLGTFGFPILRRRENVVRRDWIKFACYEIAMFLWMWGVRIADFAFDWSFWLEGAVLLSGGMLLYYFARPLLARIEDPNRRRYWE